MSSGTHPKGEEINEEPTGDEKPELPSKAVAALTMTVM